MGSQAVRKSKRARSSSSLYGMETLQERSALSTAYRNSPRNASTSARPLVKYQRSGSQFSSGTLKWSHSWPIVEAVTKLLYAGADPNCYLANDPLPTVLFHAVYWGALDMVTCVDFAANILQHTF